MSENTGNCLVILGERYYSREMLSKVLNLASATLCGYVTSKKGPKYIKMGRTVLYPESSVNEWISLKKGKNS